MDQETYDAYVAILEEELVCAMGCTEPIAVAYCAALARQTLGALPERVAVAASANIIKNVKSVVVPNTGGARGIEAAAAAGVSSLSPHTARSSKNPPPLSRITKRKFHTVYRSKSRA